MVCLLLGSRCALAEPGEVTAPEDSSESAVRETIERSLPFIEREGERWIETKKCDTCHHVPFMVWSLNAAAERGFSIDALKLAQWNAWARDWKSIRGLDLVKEGEKEQLLVDRPDELTQLLLGVGRSVSPIADETGWRTTYRDYLLRGQQEDGSWKPGGQLPGQKRPLRETQEVTTMWALVAITSYAAPNEKEQPAIDKAIHWLGDKTLGESTEWWAVGLLWEHARGNTKNAELLRAELLKRQRPDGGWGWLSTEESDALGTGQAMYALLRTGFAKDHAAIRAAQEFLRKTQQPDGAWPVRGTKESKRQHVQATATYWGTCWAVIALAETLPPLASDAAKK
jgi:hypothetical protein